MVGLKGGEVVECERSRIGAEPYICARWEGVVRGIYVCHLGLMGPMVIYDRTMSMKWSYRDKRMLSSRPREDRRM